MKNVFLIALFLLCNIFNAQELSDYKYVYMPKNFKEFPNDQFKLNSALLKKLETKGYKVIQNDKANWSDELKQNACNVALLKVVKSGNMFKTRLTFEAKDCNDKLIFSQQGVSGEKDFDLGYNEALQYIVIKIPSSLPTNNLKELSVKTFEKVEPVVIQPVEKVNATEDLKPKKVETISKNDLNNYSNGNLTFQKILIGTGKFILVNKNSSVPFATFSESTKEGVFRVVLEDGSLTLGYIENGNYVIEMPNKDGGFKKESFEKK